MTVNYETFEIPAENVPMLRERVEKLAKKARKLGVEEPTFIVEDCPILVASKKNTLGQTIYREYYQVTVGGPAPVIAGWTFLATIDHSQEHVVVRKVADTEELAAEYWKALPVCDHCSHKRRRKDTFLVRNIEDKTLKQVGRQCLRDFLGHDSPEELAKFFTYIREFIAACKDPDDEHVWREHGVYGVIPLDFLSQVAACIRVDGWVSRTAAKYSMTERATASMAFMFLTTSKKDLEKSGAKVPPISETDSLVAEKAIEWVKNIDAKTDYERNIKAVASNKLVTYKNSGLMASIVQAYNRFIGEETNRKTKNIINEWLGQVGERITTTVKVEMLKNLDTDEFPRTLVKLLSMEGHRITWFASSGEALDEFRRIYGEDTVTSVKLTVKKHDLFQGQKQTLVNRVVLA